MSALDLAVFLWFALAIPSALYVAYDLITNTPEMGVMKWAWMAVTAYTGVVGLVVYLLTCRQPSRGTHARFVAPMWKQAMGSMIHCLAGDATGIIVAAAITMALALPMGLDVVVEYLTGFSFGLLIFQALFMRSMLGGSYAGALRRTIYPEWVSMNAVMAGMAPVMVVLMTADPSAMEPTSLRFWGVMSLAALVGALVGYPVNWWLVATGLKHGMGTERAIGRGGHALEIEAELAAARVGERLSATGGRAG
ncbi:MAG TPA: DUF4396 domain-containing protein [Candidatus Limnocylindria bacterium]|nr:DUF4396 domain-containing protein [Candidatus Limnocylindria bacterium]